MHLLISIPLNIESNVFSKLPIIFLIVSSTFTNQSNSIMRGL